MNDELFNFKEITDVILKTTSPCEINGKQLEEGETVAVFDNVQSMSISGVKQARHASGGWNNAPLVFFETLTSANVYLSQGVFSKEHLSLMNNARLYKSSEADKIVLPFHEQLESDENGDITLTYNPVSPLFVYNMETGEKMTFTCIEERKIHIEVQYLTVMVDYYFYYNNQFSFLSLGRCATYGYFDLTGHTKVKDDTSGQTHTGIVHIPKLKLSTDLSIRLGRNRVPTVDNIEGVAIPVGSRDNAVVCEVFFLSDDIDSDMK